MYSHSFSGFIFIFLLTPNLEDWRITQASKRDMMMTMNDNCAVTGGHTVFITVCLAQFISKPFTKVYGLNMSSFVLFFFIFLR